ncbi:enoyl-CoA hydratase/isomerase family protein [Rhodococcus sp. G-MC3]|uniref:enoyl-CoA hydratase/isomerase family protein n=1 Tax=Rhodococcus sp. G-MC3 TaxID=3046209 RepID=UPI0024BAACB4|nr:enoyl-CoA hydratase/isomerase family protein [Rhodococcus sp. G-MC3]MDJ0394010.1 enoyl-CoA hydratase/isomerase family protein [Rhodococcus sp. G-MC3]
MGVVESSVAAGVGHIVLDRPEALNSLNGEMIRLITEALESWREDDDVDTVLVTSAVHGAFCAGADVRVVHEFVQRGDTSAGLQFLAEEHALNAIVADYPKPYVSVIDAAALGGGLGISVNGSVCVVTENAVLSVPETAIGLVLGVGSSYFLSRLPGSIGKFIGLTGARVSGADAVALGLATHFVAASDARELIESIRSGKPLADVLDRYSKPVPELSLDATDIDFAFSAPSVIEMVGRLDTDSPWSCLAMSQLLTLSPMSLVATNALIALGSGSTLKECFVRELRFVEWMIGQPDFAEGVRAVLIDKDRTPQWNPLVLEMVQPAAFQHFF